MVAAAGGSYVVKGGDTLSQIAEQFDTSVAAIVAANDIANPSRIYVGQELIVPGSDTYIVQAGDTLERIAHKTGTGSRGFMDAGIVYKDGEPLFILTAFTEHVPAALPDGTPGFAAAYQLIGRMSRLCWDALG